MCLINIAWKSHSDFPLIIVANRDEFYQRPTAPVHLWDNQIIAGKDLQDGGTWMGVALDGRFAAITNYRDPAQNRTGLPSRGEIIKHFLESDQSPRELLNVLYETGSNYNGFNLLFGNRDILLYYNNIQQEARELPPGMYALSNAFLDTPWPKVEKTLAAFRELIKEPMNEEALFQLFSDTELAPLDQLPQTGVAAELEHTLSAVNINMPSYGTRSTAVLLAGNTDNNRYIERSRIPEAFTDINFSIR
jgi:uncharacterized protein with NRDE domain